ncbi:MAG: endoglucanase [Sphingomonas sp.]|nr:MAG: endoglucanase [Sphingomonas sp.]
MDVDRRHVIAGLGGLAVAGCSKAQGPTDSAPDQANGGSRGIAKVGHRLDSNGIGGQTPGGVNWATFKARFMDQSGRIVDNGNGGISHSEGQSYALTMACAAGDRNGFERVLQWTEANLARPDTALYAWRYDPRKPDPVADRNNATDGDLLIAYALAKAADRWKQPQYAARSQAIVTAIASRLTRSVGGRMLLLPGLEGFSAPGRTTVNPCYYVWPALDLFARTGDAATWRRVIADGEALLAAARFGAHRLPADWIDISNTGAVSPAADKPPRFGFDAIRVPLYASVSGRSALVGPIRTWWQTMPSPTIPAWIDVVSGQTADYPLSAGGQAVVARTLGTKRPATLATDYYAAALQCLASLF